MSNFDIARDTLNTAMNESQGSAERELSNYQKGIDYSLTRMKAQLQDFSTSAISSDLFKGVVDGGTAALSVVTNLVDKFGVLGVGGGMFGLTQGLKGGGKSFIQSYGFSKDLCHRGV